ncbi:hypothetical protein JHK82_050728 [Glycine max]|uniref:DUF7588 domain-containing protein n=1 Tax=Glycine max TaxID=3847 RepID=A0A0R0F135_SOYBN|nr:hypothetical protein JHK86_050597 [Glycine max]KAG4936518.1 hypothetical protein JHK85_051437 [Glycine max]KAG5091950.1 hypothetical protein JHK82_050728 [Glycine max]KAG5095045.1 hypothetical protein JHK84_050633 [Glycine max]KAH1154876.1 hypothetical protein GYH30_050253 [Glycine max]
MGINATILMCLRDIRHNKFKDSLIGMVETNLGQGPVYFNCYPNKIMSLMDRNILDSLFLNIHFHGLDMKERKIPTALIYRIQYKVINTCASRVLLKPQRGETTLFITYMTKVNVSLPRTIKWDEVTLPEKWVMDKATPLVPRPAPTIEQIKQDNSEFVERVKINVLFFDWFHAYTIRENLDYPWKQDIIGDPTTNVITNWQIKDGELIQSELPLTTQYQLPKVKDSNDKPVMAMPFKTKDFNEEITSKDIKSLMEHANYTNKYLQVLGESIKTKATTKQKIHEESSDPSLWKDRSTELLSNLKCRTLANFRWYRDTFLTRSFHSQSINGDIPYESLSYGQLISYVQKVALKIFQDDKIQRQLAKEKAQTRRDLGSFCEQFGLPACPKQKKKQNPSKESHGNKTLNKKRFPRRKYSHKPSTSKEADTPKPKIKPKIICYNYGKQDHISKYCRFKKKLRNLNLDPTIEEQINNLLIETSDEETKNASSASSKENLNLIQQDGQPSSTDDEDIREINTLTREQDLLFEAINYIPDPQEKKVFLEKLRKTLETKLRPKDFITNNKFDVSNIFKRLENTSAKPTTIQDLQTEINNLKKEVKELQDEMFMELINKIKIQKFYINIRIIINDFFLDTMVLFDTRADSNCILEGLVPTKFFEKTSEKLSTTNGSIKN